MDAKDVIETVNKLNCDLEDVDGLSTIYRLSVGVCCSQWTIHFMGQSILTDEDFEEESDDLRDLIVEELEGVRHYLNLALDNYKNRRGGSGKSEYRCVDVNKVR
jgi:hypothetical protein